jgi:hypothetical protein
VTVKTVSVTGVTLPVSINPGDAWQQSTVLEINNKSTTASGEATYRFKAIGPEQVTVPSGTFNARRFDVHAAMTVDSGQGLTTTFDGSQWMVPEVGQIKKAGSQVLIQGQAPSPVEIGEASYPIP